MLWLTLLLAVSSAADEPRPLFIAPADDAALASVLLASGGPKRPVLLFDPRDRELITAYATAWGGPVRCFQRPGTPAATAELMKIAAGGSCTLVDSLLALARSLWPSAPAAILVAADDYPWLLRAAAFAGATRSALIPLDSNNVPTPVGLSGWGIDTLYLAAGARTWKPSVAAVVPHVIEIDTPETLWREQLRRLAIPPPATLVITNPNDRSGLFSPSALSLLAPLVSATHQAPLLLASAAEPATVEAEARAFIDAHGLPTTHVVLVGDELALRSHRVPDPVYVAGGPEARGGGLSVRVEIFSQIQLEQPQDYAVGRVVAESASQASVLLARQMHGRGARSDKPVIFLANADRVFALGETISRTTVSELRNLGVPVQAYYREQITPAIIQKALKQTDVLVWEGHPRDLTLEESGGVAADSAPALVVLQGCYTLDRSDPFILFEKGTQAIVATSAAIYSASGSAFARALFDGLLYDQLDLGTAVRNARNYLLALTQLKRNRRHADWRKTYRAALAFALWGDPTARASLPAGRPARAALHWTRADAHLTLTIPSATLRETVVGRYRAKPVPRAMLGGLLLRDGAGEQRQLKDLYFTVQSAPATARAACAAGDGWNVVSLFAPRTRTLSVLARPDWLKMEAPPHGTFRFPLAESPGACPNAARQVRQTQ